MINSLHDSDYSTRLTELRLPSLNYRRRRGDMILLYQIFNNLVDINVNEFFTQSPGITRGHHLKFTSAILLVCYEVTFFSHRVVNSWNSLPQHNIEARSLNDFKVKAGYALD